MAATSAAQDSIADSKLLRDFSSIHDADTLRLQLKDGLLAPGQLYICAKEGRRTTATHEAARAGALDALTLLVEEHGADPAQALPGTGETPLHCAAAHLHRHCIAYLMGRHPGASEALDAAGLRPIEHAIRSETALPEAEKSKALQPLFQTPQMKTCAEAFIARCEWFVAEAGRVVEQGGVTRPAQSTPCEPPPTAERAQAIATGLQYRGERQVSFVDPDSPQASQPLLQWVQSLPSVKPPLGYTAAHICQVLSTVAEKVVSREAVLLRAALAGEGDVLDWMVTLPLMGAEPGFELFLAGALYTADLVDEENKTVVLKDLAVLSEGHGSAAVSQKLPLYFTMNAAMRAAPKAMQEGEVEVWRSSAPQAHVIRTFAPLIRKLQLLVEAMPKQATTVFRGIGANISAAYRVGSDVVWNAFTSTSLEKAVALYFMDKGRDGTFFVIIAREGAVPVEFCSVYKSEERELLYTANIRFKVAWKLSPSLLRMMGLGFDVVVMQEVPAGGAEAVGPPPSRAQRVQPLKLLREVINHTVGFFKEYLSVYVEGRVGPDRVTPERQTQPLSQHIAAWLGQGRGQRPSQLLLGDAGTGKTSAAVAVVSWLINGLPDGPGDTPTPNTADTFPIFIPLPVLKERLVAPGGLDEYVCTSFGLTPDMLSLLGEVYDVVLVLDSLDEVGLSKEVMHSAIHGGGGRNILSLHPWCAQHCSVVVTCRPEYLTAADLLPSQICGASAGVFYLQPFSDPDIQSYIMKAYRGPEAEGGSGAAALLGHLTAGGWAEKMRNPFLLYMAVYSSQQLDFGTTEALPDNVLFDAFIKAVVLEGLQRLGCGTDAATVESAMRLGELIACDMLDRGEFQGGMLGALERAAAVLEVGQESLHAHFKCLPLRIDDYGDSGSAFTFRHKTLLEYLVARRLWREPRETLTHRLGSHCFSKMAPNVVTFFGHEASLGSACREERLRGELYPLVERTRDRERATEQARRIASNALSLMCHAGVTFGDLPLNGVWIEEADLRSAVFSGTNLSGARLNSCWVGGVFFSGCDLSGSDWAECDFGICAPPVVDRNSGFSDLCVQSCGKKAWAFGGGFPVLCDLEAGVVDRSVALAPKGYDPGEKRPLFTGVVENDRSRMVCVFSSAGSEEKDILIVDTDTCEVVARCAAAADLGDAYQASQDTRFFLLGGLATLILANRAVLMLFDLASSTLVRSVEHGLPGGFPLHHFLTEHFLVCITNGGSIAKLYDPSLGHVKTIQLGNQSGFACAPDGAIVALTMGKAMYYKLTPESVAGLEEGAMAKRDRMHSAPGGEVVYTPCGAKMICVLERLSSISVLDATTGKPVISFNQGGPQKVVLIPNSTKIAVLGSHGRDIYTWDLAGAKEEVSGDTYGSAAQARCVPVTIRGDLLFCWHGARTLKSFDITTSSTVRRVVFPELLSSSSCLSVCQGILFCSNAFAVTKETPKKDSPAELCGVCMRTGAVLKRIELTKGLWPLRVCCAAGNILAVEASEGACIVDYDKGVVKGTVMLGDIAHKPELRETHRQKLACIALSPDGAYLYFCVENTHKTEKASGGFPLVHSFVVVVEVASMQAVNVLEPTVTEQVKGGGEKVTPCKIFGLREVQSAGHNEVLVCAVKQGGQPHWGPSRFQVWGFDASQPRASFEVHDGVSNRSQYSMSGEVMVLANHSEVIVYNFASQKKLSLRVHTASVSAALISPCGTRIATHGQDGRLIVWGFDKTAETFTLKTVIGSRPNQASTYKCTGIDTITPEASRNGCFLSLGK